MTTTLARILLLVLLVLAPAPASAQFFGGGGGGAGGGGSAAGAAGNLQVNDGADDFAAYPGTACDPNEFMIELNASGEATCAAVAGATPGGSIGHLQTNDGAGGFGPYAGTSCTNQFPRALDASGAATCASVGTSDLSNGAVTYAKLQDVSATQRVLGRNTAGAGDPEEVSATSLLDWLGSTRGSILYRGASGWTILSPGTSGEVLTSNGAGADPSYEALAGSGTVTSVALSLPAQEWDIAGSPVTSNGTLTATRKAVNARGTISGAQTIDWNVGVEASATLDGSTTFTFSNEVEGSDYLLDLQPAGNAITWPTITWLTPNGQAPPVPASGHLYVYCMFRSVRLCRPTQADAASAHQVYRMPSSGPAAFGAIDLSQSAATTNQLPPSRGGTGTNTTATSGRYLKGDGSNWVTSTGAASGVGACSAGQFVSTLNSDGEPTCTTPSGGGTNPATTLEIYDDFVTGAAASGSWGSAGWGSTASSNFTAQISAEAGRPGLLRMATGGSAQATPAAASTLSTSTVNGAILFADSFDVTVSLRLNDNDANTEAVVGFAGAVGDVQPASGALIRKLAAGTTWNGVIRTSDSEGSSATASLGTTSTSFVKLRVFRVDSTTVGYQLNDGSVLCNTSAGSLPGDCTGGNTSITMPSGAMFFVIGLWNNNAASAQDLDLDYIWLKVTGLTR